MYVLNRAGPEVASRLPNKRVTMCTVDEEYLGEFSSGGVEDGQIMWPSAIALDSDGNVYVSDEALQRISIFDSGGQYLGKWGAKGRGDGEFNRPSYIAFDADDNLLVSDSLNCRVQRYTREGTLPGVVGPSRPRDGEFNLPWGIHVSPQSGDVLVSDWRNDRVQRFDADGHHKATYGTSGRRRRRVQPSGWDHHRHGRQHLRCRLGQRARAGAASGRELPRQDARRVGHIQVGLRVLRRQRQ